LVQIQNITDRKYAEEALGESEKRLIVAQHIAAWGSPRPMRLCTSMGGILPSTQLPVWEQR